MQFTNLSVLIGFVENMAKRQTQKYPLGQNLKSEKLSGRRHTTRFLKTGPLSPTSCLEEASSKTRTRNEWSK